MNHDRIQPHNLEAESTLLGALMCGQEFVPIAQAHIAADDFYGHVNGTIYAAICSLADSRQPTDKIALHGELQRRGKLDSCGGLSYLSTLQREVVASDATVEYCARIIGEKATLRRMISAAAEIAEAGYSGEADVGEAIANAERSLRAAISRTDKNDAGETLESAAGRMMIASANANDAAKKLGITSPWPTFDRATGLTFGGELIVWAAAPGVGKSMALSQLAMHVASSHGPVAFFALEMGTAATVRRLLAKYSGVPSRRLRLGDLRGQEWDRLGEAFATVSQIPITLFDRVPRRGVADVRRCIRRMALDGPVTAVVIDHANYLADAVIQTRVSKNERLDGVYQGLLEIAAEFDCVMHVVQHFNREGISGEPGLQHLRDGGNIEGHANIVVFPVRSDMAHDPERGEFRIAKNRESELSKIQMHFDGSRQEWSELANAVEAVA